MPRAILDVGWVVADSVVVNTDQAAIAEIGQLDPDRRCPGVLANIRQGLPGDAVDKHGRVRWNSAGEPVVELIRDPGFRAQLFQADPQRSGEAAVYQSGRSQIEDQLAQAGERELEGFL